jgi:hypothetical protein
MAPVKPFVMRRSPIIFSAASPISVKRLGALLTTAEVSSSLATNQIKTASNESPNLWFGCIHSVQKVRTLGPLKAGLLEVTQFSRDASGTRALGRTALPGSKLR